MLKTIKLFGFKILEVQTYQEGKEPVQRPSGKPQGAILDDSAEEIARQKEKEILAKMEGKE